MAHSDQGKVAPRDWGPKPLSPPPCYPQRERVGTRATAPLLLWLLMPGPTGARGRAGATEAGRKAPVASAAESVAPPSTSSPAGLHAPAQGSSPSRQGHHGSPVHSPLSTWLCGCWSPAQGLAPHALQASRTVLWAPHQPTATTQTPGQTHERHSWSPCLCAVTHNTL